MSSALARTGVPPGRAVSAQMVSMTVVIAVVGLFVLYPVFYLLQAAFDVGAPNVRPPTAYGLDNFSALGKYSGFRAAIRYSESGAEKTVQSVHIFGKDER